MPNALSLAAAALCVVGAALRIQEFLRLGHPVCLGIAIFYLILVVLFLFRSPSKQAETRLNAWILALGGTYLPMLLHGNAAPLPQAIEVIVLGVQCLSLVGMVIALSQLGKGFGVVPSLRQVKTHGLYRWVRHPLYATEMAFMASVLIAAPTGWNISVFAIFIGLQAYRAMMEETLLLAHDTVYQQYVTQVKYRFIPFIL
jgi:protein-S-isoprenylcysteine O-methyltransferase Ste14